MENRASHVVHGHFFGPGILCFLVIVLMSQGCGAPPTKDVPRSVEKIVDIRFSSPRRGAFVSGCLRGEVLTLLKSFGFERWHIPQGLPPRRQQAGELGQPGVVNPFSALACDEARTTAFASVGAPGISISPQLGQIVENTPIHGSQESTRIADEKSSLLVGKLTSSLDVMAGYWGWGLRNTDGFKAWRPSAGRLRDAAFDGRYVWAVGLDGLFRWEPKTNGLLPIALPNGLAGRPLTGIFRDGHDLWLLTEKRQGWKVSVQGNRAVESGPRGLIPDPGTKISMSLSHGVLKAVLGEPGFRFVTEGNGVMKQQTEALELVYRLDESTVLLSDGSALSLWRSSSDGMRPSGRWILGSSTSRIFRTAQTLLLVGQNYGFMEARLIHGEPGL